MLGALLDIVRAAGEEILAVYRGSDFGVRAKADDSPLTEADLRAHRVIADGLQSLDPVLPILSEESAPPPFAERQGWARYWLVDPLDGTKEFIERNGEFTVNIALVEHGAPVLGVVGVPAQGVVFVGDCRRGGAGAYRVDARGRTALRGSPMRGDAIRVVASRRHGGERLAAYLDSLGNRFRVSKVSVGSSLKLCILAAGGADLYPRLGPTSEWDIAAAHAVLRAAGGDLIRCDGGAMRYNAKESLLNPHFLAFADPSFPWRRHLPADAANATRAAPYTRRTRESG